MSGEIQSIYFMKPYYDNKKALSWLNSKGLKPLKRVHVKGDELRYRIREPKYTRYITKQLPDTKIYFVIGYK